MRKNPDNLRNQCSLFGIENILVASYHTIQKYKIRETLSAGMSPRLKDMAYLPSLGAARLAGFGRGSGVSSHGCMEGLKIRRADLLHNQNGYSFRNQTGKQLDIMFWKMEK
ncbi:hypothetical protein PENSUB_7611 [Penicillium subrubescens]|jgi:hypothetical protein|uniref:Uncharacterized protein n=1 Tax=Penicillium subrubescens TaxID=1316194 RepID=A0A1Q5TLB8_9EURO|nr:hypothetical protein PENSUB_7611 [Penicillium subrubescens]